MFNNQNNNENADVSVNTRGITFKNSKGFDPSAFELNFWNGNISLKMHPALPEAQRTETRVFDYETTVSTALTPEKALLLANKIEKEIFPALEAKTKKTVGITVGGNGLVVVSTGMGDEAKPYIALFKGLDENTKKPESGIHYEFNNTFTVDDYDETTGSYNINEGNYTELNLFTAILKDSAIALSGITAHCNRYWDRYARDAQKDILYKIAGKNGIAVGGNGGYRRNSSNVFTNNSSNDEDVPFGSADEQKISENVDDINAYLS